MNAGAYGSEIKDVLVAAPALDAEGSLPRAGAGRPRLRLSPLRRARGLDLHRRQAARPRRGRGCRSPAGWRRSARRARPRQPIRTRTGGSTFANPISAERKAWELIDRAGCRGLAVGGAQVSEQHCNFLINTGDATAADLEMLGEEVRRRVLATSGVDLEWEIRRIGVAVDARDWSGRDEQARRGADGRLVRRARGLAGQRRGGGEGAGRGRLRGDADRSSSAIPALCWAG